MGPDIELTPAEKIETVRAKLGLEMQAAFVPFSQSRNKGEKQPSLNWRITILRNGREVIQTDYSAGSAHCPSYQASVRRLGGQNSLMRSEAIKWECEHGRTAVVMEGINHIGGIGKTLLPDFNCVLYSLVMDSDVLDCGSFEEWAGNFGYETDSRKAESIYRACLEIALKLRNGLGEAGLQELREACQDY